MSLEKMDLILYHLAMIFLLKNTFVTVMVCTSLFWNLFKKIKAGEKKDKDLLEMLTRFKDSVEGGNSPSYSYHQWEIQNYPDYFIHPDDPQFSMTVFLRQFDLFQKRVYLEEEVKSSFMIVRFRMILMKYIPLSFMFVLTFFFAQEMNTLVKVIVAVGFLWTNYYSGQLMSSL